MWNKYALRSSWPVLVLGVWSCSAPGPEVGVSRQAVTQEAAVVGKEIATDPPVLQASDLGHNPGARHGLPRPRSRGNGMLCYIIPLGGRHRRDWRVRPS